MASLLTILAVLCLSAPIQGRLSEKDAVAIVQTTSAEQLDKSLPKFPFGNWFSTTVGSQAGVVWQMTECGEYIAAPDGRNHDLKVCTEANAVLPDGRKIIVMISIGTFRKGIFGSPTIFMAAVEQNDQLFKLKKLGELPKILINPNLMPNDVTEAAESLPRVDENASSQAIVETDPVSSNIPAMPSQLKASVDDMNAPPPPNPESGSPVMPKSVGVTPAKTITKFTPIYTQQMRLMNARGSVRVSVTIDENGKVSTAQALNGHPLLRNSAVESARKWVFKPATHNGKPVVSDTIINFEYTR